MNSIRIVGAPVSTSDLRYNLPHWIKLAMPESVSPEWYGLIRTYINVAVAAFECSPPECLRLSAVCAVHRLSFAYMLPRHVEKESPSAVAALEDVACHLGDLSALLLGKKQQSAKQLEFGLEDLNSPTEPGEESANSVQSSVHRVDAADDMALPLGGNPVAVEGNQLIAVFSWPATGVEDGGRTQGRDGDSATRIASTLRRLKATGPSRPLRPPASGWPKMVSDLASDFPNFQHLIAGVIRPHLSLLSRGLPHRMNSVLLVGPPGIGKTFFANQLAEILNVGRPMFVPMATETNNSALAGSSTFWSNSSPGRLFELLAWGQGGQTPIANPLVILDEVDKVSADRFDPLGSLYSLLEAETARTFQDGSVPDVEIDASNIRFIATANDLSAIPAPLITRTLVFHIAPPSQAQLLGVIQRMYAGIVSRLGLQMCPQLPDSVLERAVCMSPREAKVRLECGISLAAEDGRDHLLPQDWLDLGLSPGRRTIGFTQ